MDEVVNALLDTLADKVAERLQSPRKELWSAADLAERYGASESAMRRKMAAGEFGELVHVGDKRHFVPWAGVQAFEARNTGPMQRAQPRKRTKHAHRTDPGPI